MVKKYPKLFEPGYIGKMRLKNRIIKAPTRTSLANRDGTVSARLVRHYKEIASGGASLLFAGLVYIDNIASQSDYCDLGISDNSYLPGLAWLAQTVHDAGAKMGIQLCHAGGARLAGRPRKAPSAIFNEDAGPAATPDELTIDEINAIVKAFGEGALRAKTAGCDIIEVHGAHGYLLNEFLSPLTNKRTDKYGGSLENQMRILLEVIEAVRSKVGRDFPLSVRLSGTEYIPGGITVEDSIVISRALEKAGVNLINVSGGSHQPGYIAYQTSYYPLAVHVPSAARIKKAVNIPVMVACALGIPELAEQILEDQKADFIGMARPLIADPRFPAKAEAGRAEDIVPCIRCCEGCFGRERRGGGAILCSVNVAVGREDEYAFIPVSANPQKVAIIGGGPAGMEAARVAAIAGHKVTLFEKRGLGGRLIEAGTPEFKKDIRRLVDYLSGQLKKLGVEIVTKEANMRDIAGFDAVILAAGSNPVASRILGADKANVLDALEVLSGAKTGDRVIIAGGGSVGCDVALFLADQGKSQITILEMMNEIARDMGKLEKRGCLQMIHDKNIQVRTGTRLEEIVDGGVLLTDKNGPGKLQADTIVLSLGMAPVLMAELEKMAEERGITVYRVGDCVQPRKIFDAIHEAHLAALKIGSQNLT